MRIYSEGRGSRVSRLALQRVRKGSLHRRPLFMPWPVRCAVGQVGVLDGEFFFAPRRVSPDDKPYEPVRDVSDFTNPSDECEIKHPNCEIPCQ